MKRVILLAALILSASSGVAQTSSSQCRQFGSGLHCLAPPPARPLTPEQSEALKLAIIAQDRTILAPLGLAISASACAEVQRIAAGKHRQDLIQMIAARCAPLGTASTTSN